MAVCVQNLSNQGGRKGDLIAVFDSIAKLQTVALVLCRSFLLCALSVRC